MLMRTWSFVLGGALSFAAAAVFVTLSVAVPDAFAGITTTTPTPCGTQGPVGQISAFQQLPTCTPVRIVKTATPTFTATVEPSATPVPPTQEPTQPAPTDTATQPAGGSGGEAVSPPNTGSGPDSGVRYNLYVLLAAGLAAAIGAGSIVVAVRRPR
jgi:hypothetical protein